ncbi:hypothetical protein BLNAU_24978 [Blattamonas nauphoetae]|uniref:Uncharacterized protein n=1 Tax=Blattamonas nauphoetae TaxID=2049346 RepID=A0ABQ9WL76_9EUKA|nr:hypothetical protein BLNAU_24978 [Blattamonas nauphoetae]
MASSIVKFDTQTLEWTTIYACPLLLTDLAVSHTGTHFAINVALRVTMISRFDKGPVRSGGSFSDGTVKYGYVLSRQNNKITQIPLLIHRESSVESSAGTGFCGCETQSRCAKAKNSANSVFFHRKRMEE